MPKPKPTLVCVGRYQMGPEFVRVFLESGRDGSWYPLGIEDYDEPCMVLGADHDKWENVFDSLIHEAMEGSMVRMGTHYHPTAMATSDTSTAVMIINHGQMSEVATRVAMFSLNASQDVCKAWKAWKKNVK